MAYTRKPTRRQDASKSKMDRGQGNGAGNRRPARDVAVDDHLVEVTMKAFHEDIPDHTVYWGVIGKQLKAQTGVPNDQALPRDEDAETLERNSYPPGTTLQLRQQGAGGPDEVLVDLKAAKQRASGLRKDKYDDFKKAEKALYFRHEWFVQGLNGRAKQIADGILFDDVLRAQYKKRDSWQKTNLVYNLIAQELRNPRAQEELKGLYSQTRQRDSQTNRAYIRVLEEMRRELAGFAHTITNEELAYKLVVGWSDPTTVNLILLRLAGRWRTVDANTGL